MKRIAIVGGGIAGLSAAYYLEKERQQQRTALEWVLFEKSGRLGGVIQTEYRDGFVLEAGPDSFLSVKPEAAELCRELGIGGEIIFSNDSQRKTYIVVKGRLIAIPDGLQFMVPTRLLPLMASPLFSLGTKMRAVREYFAAAGNCGQKEDESVGDFVRRHFGQEMVDRVAEPLLAGVYGGNADTLSMRAVLPRFVEMEQREGSLVHAALKARKSAVAESSPSLFTSLRRGMQQMVDALVAALPPAAIRVRQPVTALGRMSEQWQVASSAGRENFDAVFMALPAPQAALLLGDLTPQAAAQLKTIQYTSSAAILLAYEQADLPPGFGFLIPASESKKMLACTFVHKKFLNRAPDGAALLRCFFSSSRLPELEKYRDEELAEFALSELKEVLRLDLKPKFTSIFRWSYSLPQYETGHLERTAEIEAQLKGLSDLHLIGNSLHGIGVPDCIRSARLAVDKLLK